MNYGDPFMTLVASSQPINFSLVLQSIGEPVVVLSGTGTVLFWNRAFHDIIGASSPFITGTSFFSIRDGLFDQAAIRENLHFLFSDNEETISFDLPAGSLPLPGRKIHATAEILERSSRGQVEQVLLRLEDTTEKYAAETAVRQKALEILERTTPVTKIWDQILIVPLIGTMDSNRAYKLIEQLLVIIRKENARFVIIDGNGVSEITVPVATHLVNAISAISLLGAQVVLTGVKPDLAIMMVDNGVDLKDVTSRISLPEGIEYALTALGYSISKGQSSGFSDDQLHHDRFGFRSSLRMINPLFHG